MLNTRLGVNGNSASNNACSMPSVWVFATIVVATITSIVAPDAHAQTTLTWDTPGNNSDISNGLNWVGGVAPNFAGDATTDSANFAAGTNTTVRLDRKSVVGGKNRGRGARTQ